MAKQVIRLNESDLARMIGEAVNELKKEGKSYKRGGECKGGNCDGHKTKMKPYKKEPKYRNFSFDDDEDVKMVNEISADRIQRAFKNTPGRLQQKGRIIKGFNDKYGDENYEYCFEPNGETLSMTYNERYNDGKLNNKITTTKNSDGSYKREVRTNRGNVLPATAPKFENPKDARSYAKHVGKILPPNASNDYHSYLDEAIKRTIKDYIHRK